MSFTYSSLSAGVSPEFAEKMVHRLNRHVSSSKAEPGEVKSMDVHRMISQKLRSSIQGDLHQVARWFSLAHQEGNIQFIEGSDAEFRFIQNLKEGMKALKYADLPFAGIYLQRASRYIDRLRTATECLQFSA